MYICTCTCTLYMNIVGFCIWSCIYTQGAGGRRQPGSSTSSDNSNRYLCNYTCWSMLDCANTRHRIKQQWMWFMRFMWIPVVRSHRSQAPPPRSLQELLERQWEQTAQFILDQAGKQNNGMYHNYIYVIGSEKCEHLEQKNFVYAATCTCI